jgi:glutathione S-transferase
MVDNSQDNPPLELWQFRVSMYPEKVRWALDYKGLPHIRHSLMPGPHAAQMLLIAGQKQMPVLRHGETLVKGSASVIDYLEQRYPDPALYPADPELRRRAIELQTWFDEIGSSIRRAFFHEFLSETQYAANLFSQGYPESVRTLYRAAFPMTRAIMKLDMKITKKGAADGYRRTREALDYVANHQGAQGYLVGEQFSVADLTAAVVLNSVVVLPEQWMAFPSPLPQGVERWFQHWADHPSASWIREMYTRHRGYSHATEDRNG